MANPANDPPIVSKVVREDALEVNEFGFEMIVAAVDCDVVVVDDNTGIGVLVEEGVDFVLDRTWDDVGCNVELQAEEENRVNMITSRITFFIQRTSWSGMHDCGVRRLI